MPVVVDDLLGSGLAATAQAAPDYTEEQDEQAEPQKPVDKKGEQGNEHPPILGPARGLGRCEGAMTKSKYRK